MNNQLAVTIGNMSLEHTVFNGAGWCKDLEHVEELARSASSAVVLGSITKLPRTGNIGNVHRQLPQFSLNALGMPNKGVAYYESILNEMADACQEKGKPLIVSIAGFDPQEFFELAAMVLNTRASMVELNFGCPNVWNSGEQKPIFAFQPNGIEKVLELISGEFPLNRVMTKMSPYSNPLALQEIAAVINEYADLAAVVTTNTFPNGFAMDGKGRPLIEKMEFGGISGPPMLPIGLGQVKQFRKALSDRIAIIGVGGISTGQHVIDYLRAGANAVQVTSALFLETPAVFNRILIEYTDILAEKEL